jgi:3-dehydroquinate synthase
MTTSIAVGLGERSYEVRIGPGLLGQAGRHVAPFLRRPRAAVVTDETVARLHGQTLRAGLEADGISVDEIVLPPGEDQKGFAGLERLCDGLLALGLERRDVVIAFGGGVIGDLTGLAAGLLKRGMDFIQIPTTLLAQVDSSVGGKTAINASAGKNLIGLFHQPRLVLADIGVLDTLPARERRAGWAEVIKYGLIDDPAFVDWCGTRGAAAMAGDPGALQRAVEVSVAAKARIVAADEREEGVRALLNLGHTFGHAFEVSAGYGGGVLLHGEAVGCGMALAYRFSAAQGLCPPDEAARAVNAIAASGLETDPRRLPGGPWDIAALMAAIGQDKKNAGGALTFILTRGIGQAFIARDVDPGAVRAFLASELS